MDDKKAVEEALEKIDLLDAHLDLDLKTNITHLEEDMGEITHWDTLAQWVILPQKSLTVYFASFICPKRRMSSTFHQLVSMAIPVVEFLRRDTKSKKNWLKIDRSCMKLLNFENWSSGELSKTVHHFRKK